MSVRQCLPWPAPCLRRTAAAVAAIDDAIHAHWSDMIKAMPGVGRDRFDGFAAACVQHELDRLNGVLTLDHLPPGDREACLEGYRP